MISVLREHLRRDDLGGPAVAVASGVAAVAGSYAVAGGTPAFVVAPVSRAVVALTPDPVLSLAIQFVGELGHVLGVALALALTVGAFALLTAVAVRVGPRVADRLNRSTPAGGVLATGLGHLALAALLAGDFGAIAAGVAGALVVALATPRPALVPVSVARRRAMRAAAGAAASAGIASTVGGRLLSRDADPDAPAAAGPGRADQVDDPQIRALLSTAAAQSLDLPGADPLVTRTDRFYEVDINAFNPTVDGDSWSLSITGAVDEEFELELDDLRNLATEHRFVTLRCVGEPLNGEQMDTALWTGVPVERLLDRAGVADNCCVMLRAADDYYEEFSLEALRGGLLAFRMNGLSLPRAHGRPVRALIPGHWGEVNVKWLTEIEVLDEPATGYWEERGWHGTGPVNTVAKLHSVSRTDGGRNVVGGHAYAGTRDVERVEVSTDGGDTWTEATLSERLPGAVPADGETVEADGDARDAWRHWRHAYAADEPHEVVVRAVDGTGTLQPRDRSEAYPSGATGWVRRTVQP